MGLSIDPMLVICFVLGIVLLYLAGWFLFAPLKLILKLVINSIIGAVVLILINLIGDNIGLHIPLNPISAVITGVFGVPGVLLLLVLQVILF